MRPRFSICIPVWEQHGYGLNYLNDLINSIKIQDFKDFEIIISDHSKDDIILNYILDIKHQKLFHGTYVGYSGNYGNGVANLNNALKVAEGEIIKIMFQDDLMFDRSCLSKFNKAFENKKTKWVVCGCNHTKDGLNFERPMVPCWNDKLLEGINTISSPSVLAFLNEDIKLFDEKLTMLMDVEYYYRLGERYGLPAVIEDCLVTNRCHNNQISSRYSGNLEEEIKYCRKKYDCN